jgi:hypothetical protein
MNFELVFGLVDPELVCMRVLSLVPVTVTGFVIWRILRAARYVGSPKGVGQWKW